MVDFIVQYWAEALLVAISGAMVGLYKKQIAQRLGVQALLRSAIVSAFNKCSDKGFAQIYERENIEQLCKQYYALGGNGVVHGLQAKVEQLPMDKPRRVRKDENNE